MHKRVKLT